MWASKMSRRKTPAFFKSPIGIQIQSILISFIAFFIPDALNRFFELTGNTPQQLGQSFDVVFRLFTATIGYLITYYNGQSNRLFEKYEVQIDTLTQRIQEAATGLRSEVSLHIAEDLERQSMDTLLARHGTEARSAPYIASFIMGINSVLKSKSPSFSRAALALLDLSIQEWERRVDDAQTNGFSLSMDEFYRLASSLLKVTKSLVVIDPTLYTSDLSFTPYFKEDFIPAIRSKMASCTDENIQFAFYTILPEAQVSLQEEPISWMNNWYEKEKIPLFFVDSAKISKRQYYLLKGRSLFIFDNEIVIDMPAADDWNVHEESINIKLLPISRIMKEFCAEVMKKADRSSTILKMQADC